MCLNCGDCKQPHPLETPEYDATGDLPNLVLQQLCCGKNGQNH